MGRKAIGPKSNIKAHRLFDIKPITFSAKFEFMTSAKLLIIFWVLISAVPVAVTGSADAPQVKRVLMSHSFARESCILVCPSRPKLREPLRVDSVSRTIVYFEFGPILDKQSPLRCE